MNDSSWGDLIGGVIMFGLIFYLGIKTITLIILLIKYLQLLIAKG